MLYALAGLAGAFSGGGRVLDNLVEAAGGLAWLVTLSATNQISLMAFRV